MTNDEFRILEIKQKLPSVVISGLEEILLDDEAAYAKGVGGINYRSPEGLNELRRNELLADLNEEDLDKSAEYLQLRKKANHA